MIAGRPAGILDEIDRRDPELGALVLVALGQLAKAQPAPTIEDVFRYFGAGLPYSRHRYKELVKEGA